MLDIPRITGDPGSGPTEQRQWLIRLENGEQKSCRELAMLQQWIVAGVVTRESLISRTGKTWKRLGDIAELGQYFVIADEARHTREARPTGKAAGPAGTMLGLGTSTARAAGGTILPDDDDLEKPTSHYAARKPTTTPPPAPGARLPQRTPPPMSMKPPPTPAMGVRPVGTAQTELAPGAPTVPARRPITQPRIDRLAFGVWSALGLSEVVIMMQAVIEVPMLSGGSAPRWPVAEMPAWSWLVLNGDCIDDQVGCSWPLCRIGSMPRLLVAAVRSSMRCWPKSR